MTNIFIFLIAFRILFYNLAPWTMKLTGVTGKYMEISFVNLCMNRGIAEGKPLFVWQSNLYEMATLWEMDSGQLMNRSVENNRKAFTGTSITGHPIIIDGP